MKISLEAAMRDSQRYKGCDAICMITSSYPTCPNEIHILCDKNYSFACKWTQSKHLSSLDIKLQGTL